MKKKTLLQLKHVKKDSECIILIHGLARSSRCMKKAARIMASYGYKIINVNYPSTQKEIRLLVEQHLLPVIDDCKTQPYEQVHFLTHSMGAILLRVYLSKNKLDNLGNIVMLAPPNQGSEIVDRLSHLALFNFLNGPAGRQLGTDNNSLPQQLGPLTFTTGIIIGNRSLNPLLSLLIPGRNDGKVAVERAKNQGMKDFILVPHSHSFIMQRTSVIQQALFFIQNRVFHR